MEFRVNLIGIGVQLDPPPPPPVDPDGTMEVEAAAPPAPTVTLHFVDGLATPAGPLATGQVTIRLDDERLEMLRAAVNDPEGYIRDSQEAQKAAQEATQARSKLIVPGLKPPGSGVTSQPRRGNGHA